MGDRGSSELSPKPVGKAGAVRSRAEARATIQPRALRGVGARRRLRGRGGGRYKNLAPREHFVVAASAATNTLAARFPALSAGLDSRERLRVRVRRSHRASHDDRGRTRRSNLSTPRAPRQTYSAG